ncbi:MAG: hypothetical protein ACI9G1_004555 [Pirellulaceae bacterium]|jgi:hypothetical protein
MLKHCANFNAHLVYLICRLSRVFSAQSAFLLIAEANVFGLLITPEKNALDEEILTPITVVLANICARADCVTSQ